MKPVPRLSRPMRWVSVSRSAKRDNHEKLGTCLTRYASIPVARRVPWLSRMMLIGSLLPSVVFA